MQKELPQILGIFRTTTLHIIFERLHYYEVTLVINYNKPLLPKSETKIFDQKKFHKNFFKVNEEKSSGVMRLNQIITKL